MKKEKKRQITNNSFDNFLQILRLFEKRTFTNTQLWRFYIENVDEKIGHLDPFGEALPDIINFFIADAQSFLDSKDTKQLEDSLYFYYTTQSFYLLLLKRKYVIQEGKKEKKEDYFNFKPSDIEKINLCEYSGLDYDSFEGDPYILLEEGQPVGNELLNKSFKQNTIINPDTLNRMLKAEKQLSSLFEKIISSFKEADIFDWQSFKENVNFPNLNELPLALIKYTDNLYASLSSKGLLSKYIRQLKESYEKNTRKRLFVFNKVYNPNKFNNDLNTIILNKKWKILTEGLPEKPVMFAEADETEKDISKKSIFTRCWSWKGDNIYNHIQKPELQKSELNEKEILSTLLYSGSYLDDEKDSCIYIFLSRYLQLRLEEDVENTILHKLESDDIIRPVKIIMNAYGKKLLSNPGILLLLSEQVSKVSIDDFNSILHVKTNEEIEDINKYFELRKKYNETTGPNEFTPGELLLKRYLKDDRAEDKKQILLSFLFFIIWGQLKRYIPIKHNLTVKDLEKFSPFENTINYSNIISSVYFAQPAIDDRQAVINRMYFSSLKGLACDSKEICECINQIIDISDFDFKIKLEDFKQIETNTLVHMVYNYAKDDASRKYGYFREMTFLSDKKKNKYPVIMDTRRYFKSKSEAEKYIARIEDNRKQIQDIDKGFSFGYELGPVPASNSKWNRALCIKIFPDSDKVYQPATIEIRKGKNFNKYFVCGGDTIYRKINYSHLSNFYMYEAMRNPETHDEGEVSVLTHLSDDSKKAKAQGKIDTLLESLYDCYKYSEIFVNWLKETNQPKDIWIPTLFFRGKLDEVTKTLASKLEDLPEDKKDFMSWFDEDGNICLDSEYYYDLSFSDDKAFTEKLKDIISKFYNLNYGDDFMHYGKHEMDVGILITLYLLYLNTRLA